jgi:fibronectin-binding autotransporter adhesin
MNRHPTTASAHDGATAIGSGGRWTGILCLAATCLVALNRDAVAQTTTTVFQDTFTTGNSATWTTSGTIGSSAWSVTRSGDDWGARINNSQLELTNTASATPNVNGWVYASTPTSGFTSPWSSTLSSNPGLVTWEFNMRQIRTDPAGFGVGSYGAAFVLGATSSTVATSGSGYAIVLGGGGSVASTDPIRLARFTGGLQGTLTDVISGTGVFADIGAEYLSVRVTYNPTSNAWLLYGGTASSFGDPTGTLSLTGSATNNTYTGTTLTSMGGYWQGSTAANQTAFFDNVYVKVEQAASPGNYWAPGAGGGGSGTWTSGATVWATSAGAQGTGAQATTGTLIFGNTAGTVTVSGSVSAVAGLQISTTGYQFTSGTIGLTGANAADNTITVDSSVSGTLNSILAGSAGMTKAGAGTLTLGGNNTLTGGITVSAGSLVGTTASLSGAITNNAAVSFVQDSAGTYAGNMSGSGSLTKLGNAALTLTGNSGSFAGSTAVSAGTLVANGNLGGTVSVSSGATLAGSGIVGTVSITTGATLSPGNSPGVLTTGDITWEGGGNYNWQLYDASLAAGTGYDTISGGALTINATSGNKFNINLWTLSGTNPDTNGLANGFSGITSGTFTLGTFSSINGFATDAFNIITSATNGTGGFANPFTGTFSLAESGGILSLVYTAPEITAFDYTGGTGNWSTAGNWAGSNGPTGSGTAAIIFSGAGGTSTNDLSPEQFSTAKGFEFAANAGSYTVSGSAISIGVTGLGIVNNSTNAQTVSLGLTLANPVTVNAASGNITISGAIDTAGNALTVDGAQNVSLAAVSGAGNLVKLGAGQTTLTGAVAAPNVTVGAGAVLLDGANLLADSAAVTVSGGTLNIQGNSDTVGSLTLTSGSVAGSGGTLTASSYTLSGGGVGANLGGGTLTVAGNSTLAGTAGIGTVNLNSGTLTLGSASRFTAAPAVTGSSGAVLALGGNESLGSLAGAANVSLGSAALTVGSANTNTSYSGNLSGAGSLVKVGSGTMTLSGNNTYSGGSTVSAGRLVGTTASLQGAIVNNAAVTFDQASTGTYSGNMSGSGSLTKLGSGTITLLGNNSYSGGSTISAGRLVGTTSSLQGAVTNDAAMTFDQTTTGTYAGNMSGSGSLVKLGSGAVTLSGNNSGFSGPTTISEGTIALGSSNALGTSSITLAGGVLSADASNRSIANLVTVTANSGLGVASSGTLTLTSSINLGGASRTLSVDSDATTVLGGGYASGGITKAGAGSLVLGTTGTLTGIGVSAGTLRIAGGMEVTTTSQPSITGGTLAVDGTLRVATTTSSVASTGALAVGPTGVVIQQGNGAPTNLLFGGTAPTWAPGSTFIFRDFTSIPTVSNRNYAMNVVFETGTLSSMNVGAISGSNPWTIQGDLTIGENVNFNFGTFTSTLTYSGNVIVGGTLGATNGARSFTVGSGKELRLENTGMLNIADGQTVTISGGVRSTATAGQTTTISGGTLSLGGGTRTFEVAAGTGAASLEIASVIANGGESAGGLTKTGAGTVRLTNVNTFTGPITISAGALALSGSGSLASSLITVAADGTLDASGRSGGLTLASSQTLAGTGTVDGLVVVGGGATVAPGNSPGILNADAFEFAAGGNFNWQIFDPASPAGTGWDLLSGTGAMNITAGMTLGQQFNVNLWSLAGIGPDVSGLLAGFDPDADYAFKFAEFAGGITGFESAKFFVNTAGTNGTDGFANTLNGQFSIAIGSGIAVGDGDTALYIVYTAIPEPSTVVLACLGLAVMGCAARRRRLTTAATRS